jgi:AAA+ ATPase superfamily predicted ATPase
MPGLMSEMVLSHASPLYGRRSRDILLEGFFFSDSEEFLNMPFQETLETYMILGGVPEYLLKASEYTDITDFVEKEFFDKFGYFYREPYFIISQEFRELRTYFSILNSITFGNTKPTDIANFVGIDARKIYPYLENLIRLGFIERRVSIHGNQKKVIYLIKDPVFGFWLNFVFKYREEIEKGVFKIRNDEMPGFFGKRFEIFIEQEIIHHFIPDFRKIGRRWHKGEEIDLLELNEEQKEIAFFECKWQDMNRKRSGQILADLKCKAALVKWHNGERRELYGIIGKKIKGKNNLREKGYLVFDFEDFMSLNK